MSILGQLGNRIQHAMRAYTPLDQKAVRTAAQTFRTNPAFDTEEAIGNLKTGEALVSFLQEDGSPSVVDRATILPPQSYMGAIDDELRQSMMETSPFAGVYDQVVDRQSAYEMLVSAFQKERQPAPQPMVTQAAPVQVTTAQPAKVQYQGFMVYNPATGGYEQRTLPGMEIPAQPVQPAVQPAPQPVQPAQTAVAQAPSMMPVMVFDPTSGQYVQKMMAMQLDPATGNYVAVAPQSAAPAAPVDARAAEKAAKEAEKERKAAEKAEKERQAEERRRRADELREERAERARRNDSVLGRMKNTAISTVSREVTRSLTRGIMGSLFGKKK